MKRQVDHSALSIAGFTDPWISKPGQEIDLCLSVDAPVKHTKIVHVDLPQPTSLSWPVEVLSNPATHRTFDQGSYLDLPKPECAKLGIIHHIQFEFYLTRNPGQRTLFRSGALCVQLHEGYLELTFGEHCAQLDTKLPVKQWLDFKLTCNQNGTNLSLHSADPLAPFDAHLDLGGDVQAQFADTLSLASNMRDDCETLNAKLARLELKTNKGSAQWHFPSLLPSTPILSTGDIEGVALHFYNQPTFCTLSSRWDGTSNDPKIVPTHYDAIHCHDDDMGACDWPASYRLKVPQNADAGIYAFEVQTAEATEQIIFFVSSAKRTAPLVFLVPTATYLAYADERLPQHLFPWKCADRGQQFASDNNLRSLYDYHTDTSGVSICSYKKPKATLRPDYKYPLCGGPHNLPVDLHFLKFLHRHNIAFDLITDHDLHAQGDEALAGYAGLMTGSHPEYMTDRMEAAIRQFVSEGGNLAYLGGNGFAAVTAFKDDLMELRRTPLECGRTWDGPLGEMHLSITNEQGGFFRHRGRGEFSLVGGAISLMGFDKAHPYTRTEQSYDASVSWVFENISNTTFGDTGIVLGGAAGYEVDATDPHLGTPEDTIILARATGFSDQYVHDATRWHEDGENEMALRKSAEITLRPLSNGAYIFAVGSVAWLGAVSEDDTMNDVGRLTLNILNRFSISQTGENSLSAVL